MDIAARASKSGSFTHLSADRSAFLIMMAAGLVIGCRAVRGHVKRFACCPLTNR
ncbi:hypothetical protein ACOSOMT5_P2739 [Acidiphilium sp. MT5]